VKVVAADDDAFFDLEAAFPESVTDEAGGGHVVVFYQ
jgi:hypothetical protein